MKLILTDEERRTALALIGLMPAMVGGDRNTRRQFLKLEGRFANSTNRVDLSPIERRLVLGVLRISLEVMRRENNGVRGIIDRWKKRRTLKTIKRKLVVVQDLIQKVATV